MFFLVLIIFIAQLILLTIVVSALLNLDVKILLLSDKFEQQNKLLLTKLASFENACSDTKNIIKKNKDKFYKAQRLFLIGRGLGILEWFLLLFLKPLGKKFLLGYKLAKTAFKELST